MVANLEFEARYGYDPCVDYDAAVEQLKQYQKEGKKAEYKALFSKHGGMINLLVKRQYQHDLQSTNTIIK